MKTLLTGFESFGDVKINPSQLVVESLSRRAGLVTRVLPVAYVDAEKRIIEHINELQPGRIVCLGVAPGIEAIHLERIALNLDDAEEPDNLGLRRKGKAIVEDAPLAYASTLPIIKMHAALSAKGIPATISNHAGSYLCNHVFFVACHHVAVLGLKAQCGFIHVPSLAEPADAESATVSGMSLERLIEAVECCLSV